MRMFHRRIVLLSAAACAALLPAVADEEADFGKQMEHLLQAQSERLFGVVQPLDAPAGPADYVPRETARAGQRIKLAKGLTAEFVTRSVARSADMIAFWPDDVHSTHLIVCIEVARNAGGTNPSVQRIRLSNGQVETILHGMSACDGIRATPWGTVLATEERTDGRAYEIIEPLATSGHWIADRATGDIRTAVNGPTPSTQVVQRPALPTMAWEGLAVLPGGVVIGGDELRPGTCTLDLDGGTIFKFVPAAPHAGGKITSLAESPLASGNVYALTISCQPKSSSGFPQFGQGCEVGLGAWVRVNALTARTDAAALGATGYYRPEDLHNDPGYAGPGVRFCWTNTGNEAVNHYAEVMCAVDEKPLPAAPAEWADPRLPAGRSYLADGGVTRNEVTTVVVNRFVEGDPRFNSYDNLAFQSGTGNLYVLEDHQFGEVLACLPDGADRDNMSDGCTSVGSIVDPNSEPTGFIFDGTGEAAYIVIMHGEQPASLQNPSWGNTDDIVKITGFKVKK